MTPRYKYRDKYFRAVIPFPTWAQSTILCLGTLLGMQRPVGPYALSPGGYEHVCARHQHHRLDAIRLLLNKDPLNRLSKKDMIAQFASFTNELLTSTGVRISGFVWIFLGINGFLALALKFE
jgi:hypothetical protein